MDATVVESITTMAWCFTCRFFLVLQCAVQCVALLFPVVSALFYCTGVLLGIGNIYCLCSDHSGIVALVILVFAVFFYRCC